MARKSERASSPKRPIVDNEASGPSRRDLLIQAATVAGGATVVGSTPVCAAESASQRPNRLRIRKNVKTLSDVERQSFVKAVHALKRARSPIDPSLCYYDQFVRLHQMTVLRSRLELGHGIAHQNPAFLPWHRKLVLLFENAVRDVTQNPNFTLPYWDWADETSLPFVFRNDFMGPAVGDPNDNYAVSEGPFRKGEYQLNLTASSLFNVADPNRPTAPVDPLSMCPFTFLTRGPKHNPEDPSKPTDLPTTEQVVRLLGVEVYDSEPYDATADIEKSFRNYLNGAADPGASNPMQQHERLHNIVHVWVGGAWTNTAYSGNFLASTETSFVGSMTAIDCSPNDPVFWLHHCNVDRIWASWQKKHPTSPYVPVTGGKPGWNLDDELWPYILYKDSPVVLGHGITNQSMLDFEGLGYSYEEL